MHQQPVGSATLQGVARDPDGKPVAEVAIYVQSGDAAPTLSAHTAADGSYRCANLPPGRYAVRATALGFHDANSGPINLADGATETVNFALVRSPGEIPASAPAQPQLYDEPRFTIAGVSDPNNLGGHGSTATARNTESLTSGITSLSKTPASSVPAGTPAANEQTLRAVVASAPENYDANFRLGILLADSGKPREALPYLQQAVKLKPNDYDGTLALARAQEAAGNWQEAQSALRALLTHRDDAELHHQLAAVEEKLDNPLEAVRQYQQAAEMAPSETNLFDWGAELLIHHASEPASEVFSKGNRLFPDSARMLIGLGVAWNARGDSDKAAQYVCKASDLNLQDPTPYLFLGRMQNAWHAIPPCSAARLNRFVSLQPNNAMANYYDAVSLWKNRSNSNHSELAAQVESRLTNAIHLDPKLAPAYLQLGIVHAEEKDSLKAIDAYQKAIEVDPDLEEAHYRLAQVYRQTGQAEKARQETQIYEQLSKKSAEELDRERREIPQFVYSLRGSNSR